MAGSSPTVIDSDFKLAVSLLVLGPLILYVPWLFGGFFVALGILLLVQTLRIRFVFDDDSLEVQSIDLLAGGSLERTGENFAVGGDNRWAYSTFVNWEFFPSYDLPILVYFKEVQTPEDKWQVGPGKWANGEAALAKGAVAGQVHFFPCIANAEQLKKEFEARGCAKL
eukprot:CAMPEP_0119310576 /NCGR_PEP_ID=MMETSP1333-20130426/19654_1 /TAXON_ID=418940 /ORGANISM="Scyphosphaera apsteinii, Strain RCC1455" /LENGTH=167 /DNA_ID=CAMNT_0007314791 /DNA_START=261 /DNA_END=764 /DNA_ORIENTATION=-